jgi:nuclear polyadenylated RNA-binding protein 3
MSSNEEQPALSTPEVPVSNDDAPAAPAAAEPATKEPTYHKDSSEENSSDDDNEEEYDPTATISDAEPVSEPTKSTNQDDEEEEEYDPTSDFPELSKEEQATTATTAVESSSSQTQHSSLPEQLTSATNNSSTSTPAPTAASTSSPSTTTTTPAGIDASIAQALSQRLFSDPEFLKLSYTEQQKRVAEEFSKLSQSIASPQQQQQQQQQQQPKRFGRGGSSASPSQVGSHRPDVELPMTPEESTKYDSYLEHEGRYNSKFPFKANSRLFVGNLPANFSKESLFRIFHVYGTILQISLKNTYAFIQFDNSASVEAAIAKEYGIPLYGKDLVLEIAKNSRPETFKQNAPSTTNEFFESRKRHREEPYSSGSNNAPVSSRFNKRRSVLECQVFVKQTADPNFAKEVVRVIENSGIATDYEFLKPGQSLDKKIKDAAYSGVIGVVLVNKNRTVDCSIYQKTPDGGIRYDEYNSVNYNDVIQLITREKQSQVKSPSFNQSPSISQPSYNNSNNQGFNSYQPQPQAAPVAAQPDLLQTLQSLPPQQLQALLALTAQQQQQQQQAPVQPQYNQPPAYNQYNQPQQQQSNTGGVDLASLLGKLQQPAAPVHQAPPHQQEQQQYGGSSYQPQPQQQPQQQYGRYGGPNQQSGAPLPPAGNGSSQSQGDGNGANNVQSLLATLAKFQS